MLLLPHWLNLAVSESGLKRSDSGFKKSGLRVD